MNQQKINLSDNGIIDIKYSGKGEHVACADADGTVTIFKSNNFASSIIFKELGKINAIAWVKNEHRLLVGTESGSVKLLEVDNNKIEEIYTPEDDESPIISMASSQMLFMVAGQKSGCIKIISKKGLGAFNLRAHGYPVVAIGIPDRDTTFVTGCYDGIVRVWDVTTYKCLYSIKVGVPISSLVIQPLTDIPFLTTYDGQLIQLKLETTQKVFKMHSFPPELYKTNFCFVPTKEGHFDRFIAVTVGSCIEIYDTQQTGTLGAHSIGLVASFKVFKNRVFTIAAHPFRSIVSAGGGPGEGELCEFVANIPANPAPMMAPHANIPPPTTVPQAPRMGGFSVKTGQTVLIPPGGAPCDGVQMQKLTMSFLHAIAGQPSVSSGGEVLGGTQPADLSQLIVKKRSRGRPRRGEVREIEVPQEKPKGRGRGRPKKDEKEKELEKERRKEAQREKQREKAKERERAKAKAKEEEEEEEEKYDYEEEAVYEEEEEANGYEEEEEKETSGKVGLKKGKEVKSDDKEKTEGKVAAKKAAKRVNLGKIYQESNEAVDENKNEEEEEEQQQHEEEKPKPKRRGRKK